MTNNNTNTARIIENIKAGIVAADGRSAWRRGVKAYALDLVDSIEEAADGGALNLTGPESLERINSVMLNGARDWSDYSYGGCSFVYDQDIASRLCTPSELKRTRNGERNPNSRETWLDVQARALYQAARLVKRAARKAVAN